MSNAIQHHPVYPAAVATAVLGFLGCIINIPWLLWHVQQRNFPQACIMFWLVVINFFYFLNATIWGNDNLLVWFRGNVLCDIEVVLSIAASVGGIGAIVCVMRGLAKLLDTDNTTLTPSRRQRRVDLVVTFILCVAFPIVTCFLHYVVQPTRYYIYGIRGCVASLDNSWPAVYLVSMWPPILSLVGLIYAGIVITRLIIYRRTLSNVLSSNSTSKSRFTRLFLVALLMGLSIIPTQALQLYATIRTSKLPYSWSAVHDPAAWHEIILIPSFGHLETTAILNLANTFAVWIIFITGRESRRFYRTSLGKIHCAWLIPEISSDAVIIQAVNSRFSSVSSAWSVRAKTGMLRLQLPKHQSSVSGLNDRSNHSTLVSLKPWSTSSWLRRLFGKRVSSPQDTRKVSSSSLPGSTLCDSPLVLTLSDRALTKDLNGWLTGGGILPSTVSQPSIGGEGYPAAGNHDMV